MSDILEQLKAPFPESQIHWRVGKTSKDKSKGIALAYIDARDAMKRLDDVVGFDNWQDEYIETPSGRLICRLGVRLDGDWRGEWIWKSDGAGETQVEGDKGAISDAFKRAAVKWGVGRYLYSLDSVWCELDQYRRIKNPPKLPSWATPEGYNKRNNKTK